MSTQDTQPGDWELAGYCEASQYRGAVVDALADGNATPTDMADGLDYAVEHVSRALRELRDRDAVTLAVPEGRRKGRYYELTERGRRLAQLRADPGTDVAPVDGTTDWEQVGYVIASQYRRAIVEHLAGAPTTPTQIAEATDCSTYSISNQLTQLREQGYVELLVEEDRRKGRIYGLTEQGEAAAAGLEAVGI